jgi:plastocyanin
MRSIRPLAAAAALLILGLGLTSCGSDSETATTNAAGPSTSADAPGRYGGGGTPTSSAAAGTAVSIKDFAFAPATLRVTKGATVTVANDDSAAHTFTADDKSFDSGQLAPGKSATQTFDAAGSFSYHCEIHKSMKGTIVVS